MENMRRDDILELEREISRYTLAKLYEGSKSSHEEDNSNDDELTNIVRHIASTALFHEGEITDNILSLQEGNGVSYFVELDKRLKAVDRIRSKIVQKMLVDGYSLDDAASKICDSLRYTIVIDDSVYTEKVDAYLHQMESLGYRVIKFKNAWDNEFYKGINASFETWDGFRFELQFHTPNGFAIKEGKLRDVYNIIRDPDAPKIVVAHANMIRKYYQAQVRIPPNAIEYNYTHDEKRLK